MLCLAGWTPVANDDHATGDTDGNVVASGAQVPVAARRAKLGSLPAAISRSVSLGSCPSKPTMTRRRTHGRACRRRRTTRRSARNGHSTSETMAARKVTKATRNEESSANPAPGPMYASAGTASASATAAASARSAVGARRGSFVCGRSPRGTGQYRNRLETRATALVGAARRALDSNVWGTPVSLSRVIRRFRFGEPIIVVSGLPRSGTSMLMRMLEAGGVPLVVDGIRAADEDNPAGYFELEQVKELEGGGEQSWMAAARGKAVKVISMLLEHLPARFNYRVVFLDRDVSEVLASQRKMLARRGESSTTGDERMAELYATHLRKVRRLLAADRRFTVLEVAYADVIADPRRHAGRIAAFLGRPLDVDRMAAAVDPALYRNRTAGRS